MFDRNTLPPLLPTTKTILLGVGILGPMGTLCFRCFPDGYHFFEKLACRPHAVLHGELWRLLTAGFLTYPYHFYHFAFSLFGFYLFCPALEKRWGSFRLARFLMLTLVLGYAASIGWGLIVPSTSDLLFGPGAALAGAAVAWGCENKTTPLRFFFFIPMTGAQFAWCILGVSLLDLIYPLELTEGPVSPLIGALIGFLYSSPFSLRSPFSSIKLFLLRRHSKKKQAKTSSSKVYTLHAAPFSERAASDKNKEATIWVPQQKKEDKYFLN
ncbi:rhomboid family intramembrane serine protease [Pajaroellobacter abortibovis]|uniref:Uncharacterized protein n=1 Tax=Pajaroellobacter abortibovis TaxID=1882918 RepID=A0A1L6MX66_9BACT|nr:rhomboid family intramembrane serine protease [Pajaroellobacter abortibovis]APS00029.1 hypothetical protein BCY86_04525 [Pajaroellobacter abortibovis]